MSKQIRPIGIFHCEQQNRYDTPRQGVLQNPGASGMIQLNKRENFEQAVHGLAGFSRIWLIFGFHKNEVEKVMVSPPVSSKNKVGVFASRSPHRPNGLGLSCVRLLKVESSKLQVHVAEFDLLDQSPIFDIKPYLPYADSFSEASTGWAGEETEPYHVALHQPAGSQVQWIIDQGGPDLFAFARVQLSYEPLNSKKKRIKNPGDGVFELAYRTWRLSYSINEEESRVELHSVYSGYSLQELAEAADKYHDKDLHRRYNQWLKTGDSSIKRAD